LSRAGWTVCSLGPVSSKTKCVFFCLRRWIWRELNSAAGRLACEGRGSEEISHRFRPGAHEPRRVPSPVWSGARLKRRRVESSAAAWPPELQSSPSSPQFLRRLFLDLGPTSEKPAVKPAAVAADVKIQPRERSQLDAALVRVVGQMAIDIAGCVRADAR